MFNSSLCTPKRKRIERSAEESAAVRSSARQKAKGQESIINCALNRKKVNSLELNSSRASQTPQKGYARSNKQNYQVYNCSSSKCIFWSIKTDKKHAPKKPRTQAKCSGRTAQADSANELRPPPAATGHRINQSRGTLASTSDQANSVSRNRVSNEGTAGLDPHSIGFQSACTISRKDEVPKVHPQGKLSAASSTFVPRTDTGAHKMLPNKSHTRCSAVMGDKSKYNDPCKTNGPKDHHPKKPVPSSSKHGYINRERILPSSDTATRKVSQSNIADSNHTTIQASPSGSSIATIAGIHSASTNRVRQSQVAIQTAHAGSGSVAIPAIRIPTIRMSPMVAPRGGVTNPSFQMIPTLFGPDKNAVSLPPATSLMHTLSVPVQGRRVSTNYNRRRSVTGSPNLVNLNSQRTYSLSSPTIPPFPSVAPRVTNPSFQNIPSQSALDKRTKFSLPPTIPTMNALKVPARDIRSSSSTAGRQYGVDNSRLLCMKSYAGCTAKPNPARENEVLHKNNVAKNRGLNENDVAKVTNKKSVLPSSQSKPTYYIKCAGSSQISTSRPPLLPLGERCQLCGIDLAFAAKGSDSQTEDHPFSAVLPCSHSYHDHCITNVFGAGEPPCVKCLENEPLRGS